MKTYHWIIFFGSLFLFFLVLPQKSSSQIIDNFLSLENNNIDTANITPICLDRSDIPQDELHWLYMPQTASELATSEDYGYLSGQLIASGVVNASACPLNGLWQSGYANTCGLEKTRITSIYLQNIYDEDILAVGKSLAVPPVMIKQLIRYESQFWPVKMGAYHYGLGHITYLGASNAIGWNRSLFEATYAQVLQQSGTGTNDYAEQLLTMMDASCTNCSLKIDVPKAKQSIHFIGEALLGYCKQTSQVIFNATQKNANDLVDYATVWKLTLLNYNVGPLCVYQAVNSTYESVELVEGETLGWDRIANNIDGEFCQRGVLYVQNITQEYYDFGTEP